MNDRKNPRLMVSFALAVLIALSAAGCGDDSAPTRPPRRYAAPPPAPHPSPVPSTTPPAPPPPDDLAANTADPLMDAGSQPGTDDPLTSAVGPKMPTAHSHWLRGQIFGAHVDVRLNGILLGGFTAPIDKDITMKLHPGVNTVGFTYRPLRSGATARLELLEGEHALPAPPLARFQRPVGEGIAPQADQRQADQTTQTDTFIAH